MRIWLTSLLDALFGPTCPWCAHRARGYRSLDKHTRATHRRSLW